jgi:hypothetical protein
MLSPIFAGHAEYVLAVNVHMSALRGENADQTSKQSGFSRSVGTHQADNFSWLGLHKDSLKYLTFPIGEA